MEIKPIKKKLKLYGFNNLTKTLSFNIYDICYADTPEDTKSYIEYIDEKYSSMRLTGLLKRVAEIVGANILNIASQDYDPQGASVTLLIAELSAGPTPDGSETAKSDIVAHLDKSHITVHTYPESHPDMGISTFRADLEVSTCGRISPLKALNFLLESIEGDIVLMDYRIRGFTRQVDGKKVFIDHKINSIQNFISPDIRRIYNAIDVNVYQENIFHTKMMLRQFDLDNYLFGISKKDLLPGEKKKMKKQLKREMMEIFNGRNIPKAAKPF